MCMNEFSDLDTVVEEMSVGRKESESETTKFLGSSAVGKPRTDPTNA